MIEILAINWKQIYEVNLHETKQWVLILYDISQNHYVGVPIYSDIINDSVYLKSIGKYAVLGEICDYNRTNIKKSIYIKGQSLKITDNEFNEIFFKSKQFCLNYVKNNTNNDPIGISYSKWCKDKLELINKNNVYSNLKVGAIAWVDLGYNIGNELRKLRPAVLW